MVVEINIKKEEGVVRVEFKLARPIDPSELPDILAKFEERSKEIEGSKILILSGAGPVWLYGALVHLFVHKVQSIAVYDPKLQKAIVIATHTKDISIGQLV